MTRFRDPETIIVTSHQKGGLLDLWVSRRFEWPFRCFHCDLPTMTAQRIIDYGRKRTTVRLWCDCGFFYEVERQLIPDHDYLETAYLNPDLNGSTDPEWRRRLASLIKFIDDDQEERQ